jgi:hypothetical protein
MEAPTYNISRLSKEREEEMQKDAIFVFDSSALLDFFFYQHQREKNSIRHFQVLSKIDWGHYIAKHQLELDFRNVGVDDRGIGSENEYQSTEFFDCEGCGRDINVAFYVWEYPVGVEKYKDISVDGATVIKCFDFS